MKHLALVALLLTGLLTGLLPAAAGRPQPVLAAARDPLTPYRVGVSRGRPGDIWSTDAVGGDARPTTDTGPLHESDPAYSPDGSLIAYTAWYASTDDPGRVMIADADGADPRPLSDREGEREPTWSPDGTMIAVTDDNGISVVRVSDGAVLTRVPRPAHVSAYDSQPAWSPDGDSIAFARRSENPTTPRVRPFTVHGSTPDGFTTSATVRTPTVPTRPEILFLVDTTGSMEHAVGELASDLDGVMGRIQTEEPDARFGLATYQDYEDGERRYRLVEHLGDRAAVRTALAAIVVDPSHGYPDLPEDWFNALHEVARGADRVFEQPDTSRIVVLAGDASSHECPPTDPTPDPSSPDPDPPWTDPPTTPTTPTTPARPGLRAPVRPAAAQPTGEPDWCGPYWRRDTVIKDLTTHGEGDENRHIHVVGVPVETGTGEHLDSRGQATAITDATGGSLVEEGAPPGLVAAAVEAGIAEVPVTVEPVAECPANVSISFTPASATVPGDTDVTFTETVRLDQGASSRSPDPPRCRVRFRFDGRYPAQPHDQYVDVTEAAGPTVVVGADAVPSPDGAPVPVPFTATATDAAGAPLTPTCDATPGALFPVGLTPVTCTATSAGRTATASTGITAFEPREQNLRTIWLAELAGTAVRREVDLTARFNEGCGQDDDAPAWSPDGNRLAYSSSSWLCVLDLGSRIARGLAEDDPGYPAWSPDGELIAFQRYDGESPARVLAIPAGGGDPTPLVSFDGEDAERPAFRPLPDLRVTGAVVPGAVAFGGTTTARFTVTNRGLAPPRAADLALTVPAGLRVDAVTTTAGTCAPTGCALGRLAPGATAEVRLTLTGAGAGRHVVAAALPDDVNPGDNRAEAAVEVAERVRPPENPGSLSMAVAVLPAEAFVGGDDLVLSFRVRNGAPRPMTDVRVVTSLPPALLPVAGCTTCPLGTLEPGQEAEVRVALPARAAVDTTAGGSVLGTGPDSDPADNTATTRVLVRQPELVVDPRTGPTGFVPHATGRGFPPGATVRLAWTAGLSPTPGEFAVRPDGTFDAQFLVFHNDLIGQRRLEATAVLGPRFGPVRSGDFLVVPRTLQPPDFASRD
ncbi:DUF11 domain-containing protein [Saccharothrix syringae]|uniref:DUF11 domain-containing protein n=1 Tax=Saccharothrix syringae TaxID=103733 RepID=A0A5Q0H7U1_SACSY|nr:DUF11 domain-containing protein [Saccharothrix syringae]QFZ22271.1 hypothetical protein EKG83_36965 [Saccharothrix syringae]